MTRKDARALAEVARFQGGFTYSLRTRTAPQSGFAFSGRPECERKVRVLSARAIRTYARDFAGPLSERGAHLGAWRDGGAWYLDVSTVSDDEVVARTLAKVASQLAVYDLATRQSLSLY